MATQKLIIGIAPAMSVEIEGESTMSILELAAFWASLPMSCPICEAAVILTHRKPQGFDYAGMRCFGSPAHETTFGEYKTPRVGVYYKEGERWQAAYGHGDDNGEHRDVGVEPKAEHDRLDGLIANEWGRTTRPRTFEESVRVKFDKTPAQLTIADKRKILDGLTGT